MREYTITDSYGRQIAAPSEIERLYGADRTDRDAVIAVAKRLEHQPCGIWVIGWDADGLASEQEQTEIAPVEGA